MDLLEAKIASKRALARLLGVTPQAITKWKNGRIPAERVLEIERVTGVSKHDLRPDLYPRERKQTQVRASA